MAKVWIQAMTITKDKANWYVPTRRAWATLKMREVESRGGIKSCAIRRISIGSIDLITLHMDSFTTISNTSNIPTNSDDGGSGNNAYCVIVWMHPTHCHVSLAFFISLKFTQLTQYIIDPHITFTVVWLALACELFTCFWRSFFYRVASTRGCIYAGFFRSVRVCLLWGFFAGRSGFGRRLAGLKCDSSFISFGFFWVKCQRKVYDLQILGFSSLFEHSQSIILRVSHEVE